MDKKALMEELEQLGKLYQAGVLSQAEFEAQKTAVLGQLQASRGGQTPMPSSVGGGGHGGDVFATGFAGSQGATSLGAGGVVGERYRLVRSLGRGGMGEVWLAEDTRLGRAFALKFLATELVGSSEALSRMHREYEVLEKLTHPNIVRVFDLDQDKGSGRWYLRMEYVEGEDLGKKIALATEQAERPLFEVERIVGWLGQLANRPTKFRCDIVGCVVKMPDVVGAYRIRPTKPLMISTVVLSTPALFSGGSRTAPTLASG